ncbi:hypothetical protein ACHAWC_006307 [Mediolabrus comicus]
MMMILSTQLLVAVPFLLGAANASRDLPLQDWYATEQAKSLFGKIMHKNLSTSSERNLGVSDEEVSSTASKVRAFTNLQKYQPASATDVINTFDSYDSFYIEVETGPCVWSECAIDATDKENMGDKRDGDELWYQFRTQSFCANAAYSLYGRKKGLDDVFDKFGNQCSKHHFINSFFTYGGSDNLLTALGQTPAVYWGSGGVYSNSECVDVDGGYDGQASYSTLGCSSSGEFTLAYFDGNSCDGNYFVGAQSYDKYNSAFESVEKCQNVEKAALYTLLSFSWPCDVRLYPNGQCPDPYQRKAYYEYALSVAHSGGNPIRAYRHLVWKDQLRFISWMLFLASCIVLFVAFSIKNCAARKMPSRPTLISSASCITFGDTKIELDDGGKTMKVMERVSKKALAAAASVSAGIGWLRKKLGRKGSDESSERTFQTSSSSGSSEESWYKYPETAEESKSGSVQLARMTAPSTVRRVAFACDMDENSQEVIRTRTSPHGRVLEDYEAWLEEREF